MELNILLLGSGSNKRSETVKQKPLREFRLGGHEDDNNSEESILLKFWKILTPEARIAVRSGEEVNIGLINDSSAK